MTPQNGSGLKFTTTCKIPIVDSSNPAVIPRPCGFKVVDHPLNVQIIGQPDMRIQRFLGALMTHLQKAHPEALATLNAQSQFFFGFLTLGMFETPDPALLETKQRFAAFLRQLVSPPPVADVEIMKAAAAIEGELAKADDIEQADVIAAALKHLRNYYEGKLPGTPATPAENLVIAP